MPPSTPTSPATASPGGGCALCGGGPTSGIYSLEGAPITCATTFPDASSARAVPLGSIDLQLCHACGFIWNARFDAALAEAGARYEATQAASQHFGAFARGLAGEWVERYDLHDRRVLEVGCGHGEFLGALVRAGAAAGVGLDPVADPDRLDVDVRDRVHIEARKLARADVDVDAAALVCRHTLEHIGDVPGFLALVRAWAATRPDRVVLFEVPASERILAEAAFWDVYYEHASYFTVPSLRHAFELAGFEVLRTELVFGDQFVIIEALASGADAPEPRAVDTGALTELARSFGERSLAAIDRARDSLRAMGARSRPLVIWQGAGKTVGFTTALGDDSLVDFAVDVNPQRHDQFLPPHGLQVRSPADLEGSGVQDVVLMNPAYVAEVSSMLVELGVDARLATVESL